ncbi:ribosome biogenesis protein Sqt1 [Coniophora puteana RWD-64-598 SS2]|uniref:Ribosome biogenesis protein Sqt1 n=1 Tax=Coniophora puteana (strain RWD-64-598) TaxID=741705 RepID=A0A5M3N042_CONPW|nr:ribosome biogenesis protein Sqt1 [Coniophora puteana RWD-64-598 SS2]EIW84275.1 ribosome biogenesis protein Sqt1 [Coniophora puteana RWD-64-598 SS2]
MATDHVDESEYVDEEEVFIDDGEVLQEVEDGEDHPMDEDDEADDVAELPSHDDADVTDTSEQHFEGHDGSVFVVACHPTEPLAVSGGEDDLGYIWDITDGEVIVKLTGHSDSVSSAAFSADGQMVATGGMDGKVRVWRRVGTENFRTWEFLTELQGPDEVIWLRWHPRGNVLLAGSNDSMVWLWQLPSGNTMQVFAGHTGPVQCGEFTPDGKRVVTACADGSLIMWDPRSPTAVFKLSPQDARFDTGGITSLAVNPSSTLAVVGGHDGSVRIINLTKGEIVGALGGHAEGDSVESIQFVNLSGNDSGPGVVVTGGTDGKACIWDLSTMRQRATLQHQDAVTTLLTVPAPKSHLIISGSADRTLRTWDGRTGTLLKEHSGHHGPVLGASLGLRGEVVVSAGDDGLCLVYTTEKEEQ